jgi:hypothetical protein
MAFDLSSLSLPNVSKTSVTGLSASPDSSLSFAGASAKVKAWVCLVSEVLVVNLYASEDGKSAAMLHL